MIDWTTAGIDCNYCAMETRQEVTNPPINFEPDDLADVPESRAGQEPTRQDWNPVNEGRSTLLGQEATTANESTVYVTANLESANLESADHEAADHEATDNKSSDNEEIQAAIASQLQAQLGRETFELWFSTDDAIQCDSQSQTLTFVAEHEFGLNRLQTTFGQAIRKITSVVCGPQYQVRYEIALVSKPKNETTEPNEPVNAKDTVKPAATPKPATSNRPTARTLRSFWFGEGNKLLQAAVDHLQREPGQFSPLMIHGPAGCGKTHLLEAIIGDTRRRSKKKRCVYLTSEQFTTYFIQSLRGSGLPMFRRKYRDLDVLAIDDVQFFAKKKATIAEFQFTIDNLVRSGKQIVLASDCPPFELDNFQDELTARMSSGLVCQLQYPDELGRVAIARRMCAERSLTLPNSVIELVAHRLTKDVRRISGAINRLHALKVATEQKITDELAEEVLSDLFAIASSNSSMTKIEKAVCELCGVKASELKSSSRKKRISTARMLAMYLSRKYTSSAFSEIGDHFGGRSHSTVIAAERKVDRLIQDDQRIELPNAAYSVREVISRIESKLRVG